MKKIITTATIRDRNNNCYIAVLNDTNEIISLRAKNVNYIYGGELNLESKEKPVVPVIGTPHQYNEGQYWWIPDFKRIMSEREPESQTTEYKSSLLHTNFDCPANNEPRLQMDELARSMAGGWNSGHPLDIFVGVDNRTRAYKGLSEEVQRLKKEEYIAQFRNHLSQISSGSFFVIPKMDFEVINNREIFHIHVPANERGDLVLLRGTELWVRLDASNHMLKNEALIQYITDRAIRKNTNLNNN
jgi:hypothetical protein